MQTTTKRFLEKLAFWEESFLNRPKSQPPIAVLGQVVFSKSCSVNVALPATSQMASSAHTVSLVLLVRTLRDGILCSASRPSAPAHPVLRHLQSRRLQSGTDQHRKCLSSRISLRMVARVTQLEPIFRFRP